jgi:hypothetical protein
MNKIKQLFLAACIFVIATALDAATLKDVPTIYGYQIEQKKEFIIHSLKTKGAVLIKQAFPRNTVVQYSKIIKSNFAALDDLYSTRNKLQLTANQLAYLSTFEAQGGFSFGYDLDQFNKPPVGLREYVYLIRSTQILPIIKDYLQAEPIIQINGSSARRQAPATQGNIRRYGLKLHQDGSDLTKDGVVFWIPLVDIDAETPTLKVVLKNPGRYFTNQADSIGFSIIADQAAIEKEFKNQIVTIDDMLMGDVLVFDFSTIHSTYTTTNMNKLRYSMDVRILADSNVAANGDIKFLL